MLKTHCSGCCSSSLASCRAGLFLLLFILLNIPGFFPIIIDFIKASRGLAGPKLVNKYFFPGGHNCSSVWCTFIWICRPHARRGSSQRIDSWGNIGTKYVKERFKSHIEWVSLFFKFLHLEIWDFFNILI